jgi:parvulin-like peptidyl-prolyl isomerase
MRSSGAPTFANGSQCERTEASSQRRMRAMMVGAFLLALTVAADAAPLARQGAIEVHEVDLRLHLHELTDREYETKIGRPSEVKALISAILSAKTYAQSTGATFDPKFQSMALERLRLDYDTVQADRSVREWAQNHVALVEQRARELYVAADTRTKAKPRTANFQHIYIDLAKYPFKDVFDRVVKIQTELEAGVDFSDVARRYSDDGEATKTGGKLTAIRVDDMDDTLKAAVLKQLKPGGVSQPLASRRGLHIVKLLSLSPEFDVYSFEEIKPKYIEQVINEAMQAERKKLQSKMESPPIVFDENELAKLTKSNDPATVMKIRQEVIDKVNAEMLSGKK